MTGIRPGVRGAMPSPGRRLSARGRDRRIEPGPATALSASLAIVASAFLWGTWWIPLRQLDAAGVGGAWATGAALLLPIPVLAIICRGRLRALRNAGRSLWMAAVLVAASTALYAEGLIGGQVARVLLLFYLTPVWSTMFGRFMLNEPITPARIATIVLGLSGMLTIFGAESGIPVPRHAAEWMGLTSGVCWGLGIAYLRRAREISATDKAAAIFVFVGPFFLLLNLLFGGRNWMLPSFDMLSAAAPWLIALALLWTLPVIWLTAFGGSGIDPGRVAILLMLEIVIGLVSAAWLTDEPFGPREFIGGLLIVGAGATEFTAGAVRRGRP